ncbi:1,2-phenylacetyl-CoA epoxidase subunit PaaD [Kribbella sp. NPDC048928]|uniref:1,2-phenylacetyl-CoA epoxidase subunit PaaD n=1 Tax=Kribbella sp. NPDC048928 TaxID=3364111 RepID=UPI00371596B2
MVTDEAILEAVGEVADPEIPVLTIADLGILRGLHHEAEQVVVTITPTYSGCPAMDLIRHEVELTLQSLNVPGRVETTLSPPWTTDWMTQAGKAKLTDYGIAPPSTRDASKVLLQLSIRCPLCGSPNTSELSRFGSTSCKSLWRCNACKEPFDHFKSL